ncbi:response regulator [Desulfomonile tiedjei]|uniref:Response regulator with CheY-like receiver domain and winged-helix DNA-binding domain n=1 Tax=Desulfomonile tiedjei (strain ATCC 49306 / DSM 6799 / DCB-1) TaxID=706587 RepID=I4C062_DESTA|nr:response regulator [Desulfomonile tiedjei]AFM22953.1 response regulator with CheY-like receiver domain and winged-helix DNA-binding domain [Desulfomonile tiedjei DSM 6799]
MTEKIREINILLVEDNPIDVLMTRKALERWEIANCVNIVRDGQEALDFLFRRGKYVDSVKPDLVFLDLNLPKKNGKEVLFEISGDPNLSGTVKVVVTTSDILIDVQAWRELGADLCIVKPVDFDAYIEMILSVQDYWEMVGLQSDN